MMLEMCNETINKISLWWYNIVESDF